MGSFVRRVRTASGATAVQIVHKRGRRVVGIDHIGSAHDEAQLGLLLHAARERLHAGQGVLELGLSAPASAGIGAPVVEGTSSRILWDALVGVYASLGFDQVGDDAFRALVLGRIIEPTSKVDTIRVLTGLGVASPSRATFRRCLQRAVERDYRGVITGACYTHATRTGALALVLYDLTVRHEALVVRAEVRDLCLIPCRSRGFEAGGSLTGETTGRAGAALTKPWRVSTVGWRGRGERAEEVYARNRCHHLS